MSNNGGTGASGPDIVTYIGVPLAVLGVLPILYTFVNSIVTSRQIRRSLRHNATEGNTRSSLLSGIVEVELPRYSLHSPPRDDPDYWSLNPHPSRLKGGSWSIFNWKKLVIGKKTYRVEYSSDIQEPQADINFSELLAFLIDHGAVPDAKGFKLLNMAGLWTPANTSLLVSANRRESVLRVAFPDDSDGILSLALQWAPSWGNDHGDELPPHWMRLRDHREPKSKESPDSKGEKEPKSKEGPESEDEKKPVSSQSDKDKTTSDKAIVEVTPPSCIRIHLAMSENRPILDAAEPDSTAVPSSSSSLTTSSPPPPYSFSTPHLQIEPVSTWLPTFAAALGMVHGHPLYLIHLPSTLTQLSMRDALPCGVLEELQILRETETPSWATPINPHAVHDEFHDRFMRQSAAQRAEASLPPAQRATAATLRRAHEQQELMQSGMRRMARERERRELREREALESVRLETGGAVLKAALRWLRRIDAIERGNVQVEAEDSETAETGTGPWREITVAVETVLYQMVVDPEMAGGVCTMLERWKAWVERGGMNAQDLHFVREGKRPRWLCYSIVLMALLKAESTRKESTLALDLQECVRTWKQVRLG